MVIFAPSIGNNNKRKKRKNAGVCAQESWCWLLCCFFERERVIRRIHVCARRICTRRKCRAYAEKKDGSRTPRWCHWQQQEQMHPEPRRNRLPKHNQTTFLRLFHQHSLTKPCFGVAMVAMKHKSNEPKAFSFSFSKTTVGSKTPFWLQLIFGHTQTSVVVRGGSFFVWEALSCDGENQ